jgi:hypothetical protein
MHLWCSPNATYQVDGEATGKLLVLARRKPRDWARQEAGREYKEPVRPLQRDRAA